MRRLPLLFVLLLFGCPSGDAPRIDGDGDGSSLPEDCDDSRGGVHPGAAELCDGLDNDCDGAADEGWDEDADGFKTCGAAPDCDDTDPAAYPGAEDVCDGIDNDCNGLVDDGGFIDVDVDGFCSDQDCDDNDAGVHPGVPEICDGVDQDCNGLIDEGFDGDLDGHAGCGGPDCDDTDPAIHPGAAEICDGVDQDCDDAIDETFDADADGVSSCSVPPDCDDTEADVYPGAPEQCNNRDDDCDGIVDEDTNEDLDGDGLGACAGDCDDTDASIHPGALDVPNGIDDNCDGVVDEDYSGDLGVGLFAPSAWGTVTQGHLGQALSTAGDFNGDGLSDFASGSGSFALGSGRVELVLGAAYDAGSPPPSFSVHATIDGDAEGIFLGERVDLGDVNGDGYDDLIVGQPMFNSGPPPAGAVYVWFGEMSPPGGAWSLASADVVIDGEQAAEQCGTAVAALGDVNGDGMGDLGFTCPWYSATAGPFQGRLLVFFGGTTWPASLGGADADASIVGAPEDGGLDGGLGQALAGDFDFNGDGVMDVALGSSAYNAGAGRAALKLGGAAAWALGESVEDADAIYTGGSGAQLGHRILSGDGDGDAYADLLFGSPDALATFGNLGVVHGEAVPVGGTALATSSYWVSGAAATEQAGTSAVFIDLNGDGERDLAVSIPGHDGAGGDSGRVALWYGDLSPLSGYVASSTADLYVLGIEEGDFLGGSMVALPDFNGDGAEDLVVSAPFAGSLATGTVYVVPGF